MIWNSSRKQQWKPENWFHRVNGLSRYVARSGHVIILIYLLPFDKNLQEPLLDPILPSSTGDNFMILLTGWSHISTGFVQNFQDHFPWVFTLSFWWFPPIFPWVFSSKLICFSLSLLFVNHMRYECCAGGTTGNDLPTAGDLGTLLASSRSRAEPWWGSRSRRPLKFLRSYSLH